jgi:uncharacterized protein YbbC (DUF1343 family)
MGKSSLILFILLAFASCGPRNTRSGLDVLARSGFDLLKGKSVGLVVNHTSVDREGRHILDLPGIRVKRIFSPEHGLEGRQGASERVEEMALHVPVISLYRKNKKPTPEELEGIDALVFDLQDAGARFYTYASTMTFVMQAAAENGIEMIVLDRPNPLNGVDVQGPLLEEAHRSFVGLHPVPIRHGLTLGELATMINESGWLEGGVKANLTVVPMENWSREQYFQETGMSWIPPSPNLPDLSAARAYPGTCLLEGTNVSEGRGTEHPFTCLGAPWIDGHELARALNDLGFACSPVEFTPRAMQGAWKPKYENEPCRGIMVKASGKPVQLGVYLLASLARLYPDDFRFLKTRFIDRLYGSGRLREAIETGEEVRLLIERWQPDLEAFRKFREPFLIYGRD